MGTLRLRIHLHLHLHLLLPPPLHLPSPVPLLLFLVYHLPGHVDHLPGPVVHLPAPVDHLPAPVDLLHAPVARGRGPRGEGRGRRDAVAGCGGPCAAAARAAVRRCHYDTHRRQGILLAAHRGNKIKVTTDMEGENKTHILLNFDNNRLKSVPINPNNTDYQAILKWVAEGNTIAEAD